MPEWKELTVTCLCESVKHTFDVPTSSLPLATYLCSCDISRRISGSLLTSYFRITHGSNPVRPDLDNLTPYKSSEILTRHFCTRCGTHMYLEYNSDGHFEAATGTLREVTTDGLLEFKAHMWIEDTLDGGAAPFISDINGSQLRRYLQELSAGKEAPFDWRHSQSIPKAPKQEITYAHCHCKGVEFYISPPNEASKLAASDWPDLIIPNEAGASKNITNYPWWLPTQDRYLAGTCTCRTCTRASGFDIMFWAFVPVANITLDAEGKTPFTRNSYWGSMRSYRSREDVTRSFCGGCGANVFYDGHSRPSLVDVAVGLIDEPSGARAEELLAWWTDRVSFREFALNKALVEGLEEGLKEWGRNNKGASFVAKMHVP